MEGLFGLIAAVIMLVHPAPVSADSASSYTDYLSQADRYRTALSEFRVARSEYLKYQTLTSESAAFDKTKTFIYRRNDMVSAYLVYLRDKINEAPGVPQETKTKYADRIAKHLRELTSNSGQTQQATALSQTAAPGKDFAARYPDIDKTMIQASTTLTLGEANVIAGEMKTTTDALEAAIKDNSAVFTSQKRASLTYWLTTMRDSITKSQQLTVAINADNDKLDTLKSYDADGALSSIKSNTQTLKSVFDQTAKQLTELTMIVGSN
jgi:hypothetical protein